MSLLRLQKLVYGLRNAFRRSRRKIKAQRPRDPRVDADPWLAKMLDDLGDRYQFGKDLPEGIQVLRRTARTRFNPMRVYVRPSNQAVVGDYDVRVRAGKTLAEGRALLDRKVTVCLVPFGVLPVNETVEEWGGQVIVRRYEGLCPNPLSAAAAVRFMCEESEQVMDASAE